MSSNFVTLVITHSSIPNFRVEKNFDVSLTISELKKRVRRYNRLLHFLNVNFYVLSAFLGR